MVFGFVYLIDNKMINRLLFKERFSYFDKKIVVEIIDIFIEEYDERIIKLTQFIKDQNLDDFRKAVHAFKGVMANFDQECLAYQKIVLMHHQASRLFDEILAGRVLNQDDSAAFFRSMTKEFEIFKPSSLEMLNDLKTIRTNYL